MTPIAPLIEQAKARWNGAAVGSIAIEHPNTARATIELRARHGSTLFERGGERLRFDGVTGAERESPDAAPMSVTRGIYSAMVSLHLLRFADPFLRALFFAAGLLGTAMVATGLVLWTAKRAPERIKLGRTPFGHRLVEVLNVGAVTGLLLAVAAYFWANRLLPAEFAARADWEIRAFFIAWLASLLHALIRSHRRAWIEQLALAAALYALPPLVDALRFGWPQAGVVLSVDLVLLTMAVGLGYTAWRVAHHQPARRQSRRKNVKAASADTIADPATEPG